MTASTSGEPATVCGAPVVIPGVFTAVDFDTGRHCQRAAGHDGPHRWSATWDGWSPAEVEAELLADYEKWDKPDE
ncbi:MAG: hypothetical protein QOG49_1090 [Frankiaceae bacterium]|nr:hypothetical protein [Frankiaceae bacterium]